MRVKGGMALRAYFVATKDSPKSRAIMVKARKGRMPASPRGYPPPVPSSIKRGVE